MQIQPDQLEKLRKASEIHIRRSRTYLTMLRGLSEPVRNYSERNPYPWRTLKEGSYYLQNAYRLVAMYKDCSPDGSIDNQSIKSLNDFLVALEFDINHITNDASGRFASKGEGKKYYKLLNSRSKENVRLFIELVELNIDPRVKEFLELINKPVEIVEISD